MMTSSEYWRALLHETNVVEQLSNKLTGQAIHNGAIDAQLQRQYLVRRAALADRADSLQRATGFAITSEVDADLAARHLLDWDREHHTGQGTVPAAAARWDADPRGYVHQEHASLCRDDQLDDPDAARPRT
ncbi:hypothetical protein [Streptomyces sp. P17]|uniref:Uncharacterized protein n=2 Tax=Streptomyces TaxID=1883 RepID=G2G648_9ACTN|nr:hypothetical protein [Streptomyces sp. P17]EGX61137.1 hypothetical protein SZN_04771 [Streptomyces zinciresistens K42]